MSKTMFLAGRIALLLAGLTTGVGCGDQNSLESGGPASQGTAPVKATDSSSPPAASSVSPPSVGAGGCAATIDFHDGAVDGLALGSNNQVFGAPSVTKDPVMNYESQVVFPNPSLTMLANFGEPVSGAAAGTVGSLAELAIPVSNCASLAGRKVRVTVLWHLDGAIGTTPTHGLSLGTNAADKPVTFSDAAISCVPDPNAGGAVVDGGCGARTLNTLNPVELVHTFAAAEDLSGGLFLRVHLVSPEGAIPTTFHVASISWE